MGTTDDIILTAHGGGGQLTARLIEDVILPELGNDILAPLDDAACIGVPGRELAFTTDSYVVDPPFFPGGDIGRLAVCGTVNDLTMQGAEPRYLSLAMIVEEGFRIADLRRIIRSVRTAAEEAEVLIVAGDTKVVERRRPSEAMGGESGERRGKPAGIFLNTAGIGVRLPGVDTAVANARPGDEVILTGTMGDHGMAVMNAREGLDLKSALVSDVTPLWSMIGPVLRAIPDIRCLRDPTRGGVAAALCAIAAASRCGIRLDESVLPVKPEVRGSCAILGLDPLAVANEGKAVMVCSRAETAKALDIVRSHPAGRDARVIGRVVAEHPGLVVLDTTAGGERIVDVPTGEDLPRIC